jgi:hypothetical protein
VIRRRRNRSLKTLLAALIVIGSICCVTVSGTYAVFTSQETNVAGTIASGTLTLQNSVNGGTACTSYGGSDAQNYNTGCTALATNTTTYYPVSGVQSVVTDVAITDSGSLTPSSLPQDLTVYMPSCNPNFLTSPSSYTSPSAGVTGGGNACMPLSDSSGSPSEDGLQMTIHETDSSYSLSNASTKCWWDGDLTLTTTPYAGNCTGAPGYSTNVLNSFGNFAQNATSTAAMLDLGTWPTTSTTRYFVVTITMPTNASNTLQGEEAVFDLTWRLST